MINKENLSKISIGAWGIGGFAKKDPQNNDEKQIKALTYSFNKGMNLAEVNFWNAEGYSVKLLKKALDRSKFKRENIFLVQAIYSYNNDSLKDIEKELELCLKIFETDFIDSIEFPLTAISKYGFANIVGLVEKYLSKGKARYTSVTNFNLEYFKKYHKVFGKKLFSHELCYNFEIRENEDLGILDYALENNIINVCFQPLRRNRTAKRNWPLLVELAKKYQKTQNQIILNWMISRGLYPLVKSETIKHIDENLKALDFKMEKDDIKKLTDFRPPNYRSPEIDWFMKKEKGVFIHALPNVFDEMTIIEELNKSKRELKLGKRKLLKSLKSLS
jgi:diketogulonate reductase-like aldo/keto reductase